MLATGEGTDTIVDFEAGADLVGLAAGLTFGDLTFDGSDILLSDERLCPVEGVDAETLTEFDFVIV